MDTTNIIVNKRIAGIAIEESMFGCLLRRVVKREYELCIYMLEGAE